MSSQKSSERFECSHSSWTNGRNWPKVTEHDFLRVHRCVDHVSRQQRIIAHICTIGKCWKHLSQLRFASETGKLADERTTKLTNQPTTRQTSSQIELHSIGQNETQQSVLLLYFCYGTTSLRFPREGFCSLVGSFEIDSCANLFICVSVPRV